MTIEWRKEERTKISEGVQRRDKLFEDNALKRFIRRILGTGASSSGTELIVRDKITGAPRIITDPEEIKESETCVMEEWMGLGRVGDGSYPTTPKPRTTPRWQTLKQEETNERNYNTTHKTGKPIIGVCQGYSTEYSRRRE
jgi:hypothetical protein